MDHRSPSTSDRERQFVGEDLFVAFCFFVFLCADLRSPLCAGRGAARATFGENPDDADG